MARYALLAKPEVIAKTISFLSMRVSCLTLLAQRTLEDEFEEPCHYGKADEENNQYGPKQDFHMRSSVNNMCVSAVAR